ncbi:MAG: hypothetical protein ACYSX0_12375 [Planctomycetota bacterium]|jgi:uncharacterized CHY-type Zn-finger protein
MTALRILSIRNHAAGAARNHYCARCRKTQAFADLGATLHCPVCEHRLVRLALTPALPPVARRSA